MTVDRYQSKKSTTEQRKQYKVESKIRVLKSEKSKSEHTAGTKKKGALLAFPVFDSRVIIHRAASRRPAVARLVKV